jgi:tetratricopeptide (TPR) repeat protein
MIKKIKFLQELAEAKQYLQTGNKKKAIIIYEKIVSQSEECLPALEQLANLMAEQKNYAYAIELFARASKISPHNPVFYFNQGIILFTLEKHTESLGFYNKAITLNPDYIKARIKKVQVLLILNKPIDAIIECDYILSKTKDSPEIVLYQAQAFKQLHLYQQAFNKFNDAITLKPDFVVAHNNKGNLLKELGFFEDAIEAFSTAISIDSYCMEAYCNRGNTLRILGYYTEAKNDYQTAISIQPKNPDLYKNLGNISQELKEFELARISYDTALDLHPIKPAELLWSKSLLLILLGEYKEGWALYEWRWAVKQEKEGIIFPEHPPLWLGQSSIGNKVLVTPFNSADIFHY